MFPYRILVEEEGGSDERLVQKVGGESRDEFEDRETGAGLQNEQSDGLLEEQSHNNSWPGRAGVSVRVAPKHLRKLTRGFQIASSKTPRSQSEISQARGPKSHGRRAWCSSPESERK